MMPTNRIHIEFTVVLNFDQHLTNFLFFIEFFIFSEEKYKKAKEYQQKSNWANLAHFKFAEFEFLYFPHEKNIKNIKIY